MMPTYTFTGPSATARRSGECPTCGKRTTRSRTFERTVNPFNVKIVNGERVPKTWDEVRADVQTDAEAWAPEPELFEHEACRAARTSPPRAEPVGMPAERAACGERMRAAMVTLGALASQAGLPVTAVDFFFIGDRPVASVAFVPDGEIVAWARALGLVEIPIETASHCTYIRLRAELDSVDVRVHAALPLPWGGDRLGGASVEWDRDKRGRQTGWGTVSVEPGYGTPRTERCALCGGRFRVEHGTWGVFPYSPGGHYPPEAAVQKFKYRISAKDNAEGYGNHVVRFIADSGGAA
jgi:hypothetical protein